MRGSDADTFASSFEEVYGLSLDTVVVDLLDPISCTEGSTPLPRPYNCTAPTLSPLSSGDWAHARSLACSDNDVVGGFGVYTNAGATASFTIKIPEDGHYRLAVFAETPRMRGVLTPCDVCSWRADSLSVSPDRPRTADLTEGTYTFSYVVEQPDAALVAMALESVPPN